MSIDSLGCLQAGFGSSLGSGGDRLAGVQRLQRIAALAPGFDAAQQGPHADHSLPEQLQRRPGAGGFVWSRTVEDDVLITGNLLLALFQLV